MRLFIFLLFSNVANAQWMKEASHSASIYGGYAVMNSELRGPGLNAAMSNNSGFGMGAMAYGRMKDEQFHYRVKYHQSKADFKTPAALGGASANVTSHEYSIGLSARWLSDKLDTGVAYFGSEYIVDINTPAITDRRAQGLQLYTTHYANLTDETEVRTTVELLMPYSVVEAQNAESGYSPEFVGFRGSINLHHSISSEWFVWSGIHYKYDYVTFKGAGRRGNSAKTLDAIDLRTELFIPIGIGRGF